MSTATLNKNIQETLKDTIQVLEVLDKTTIDWSWDPSINITKFIFKSIEDKSNG